MCEGCISREVFEKVVGELREEIEQQGEEIEQLREEIEQQGEEIEQQGEEIEQQGETMGKNVEGLHNRVSALKADLESPEPDDEVRHPDDPPLFDLLATPRDRLEPTEKRLAFFWRDVEDYTTRTPAGRVIDASNMRRVLQAGEDTETRIESNQVARVMDLAETLTRGAVSVRRKERRERLLVIPSDWLERAREAASEPAREGPSEVIAAD